MASSFVRIFSSTMSIAIFREASGVLFPFLVCRINSLEFSIVNSISCMSLLCFSSFLVVLTSSSYMTGIVVFKRFMSSGVLIPATISSPCALSKTSPKILSSPVEGFLVNSTPVPDFSLRFPNTIS